MHRIRRIGYRLGAVAGLIGISAVVAACGSSSSTTSPASTGAAGSAASSTAAAASTTASATPAAVKGTAVSTASGPDGIHVTGAGGRPLYLWVADKNGKSSCYGQCAKFWPPLTTTGKPVASGSVKASLLGTVKRSDGTTEVTYNGQPLYYFLEDKTTGSFKGQGSDAFGADWWLVSPSGVAIHKGDPDASGDKDKS